MDRFTGLLGIALILGLAFALSNNRRRINYRVVGVGLGLQLTLAVFILKTAPGKAIFGYLGAGVKTLLGYADAGAAFVFGPLVDQRLMVGVFGEGNDFVFFFKIIPTIIFVSVLVAMAYHIGLMQRVVSLTARGVHALMRVSGAEAVSNVASAFVGQVEAQIMIKPYLKGMTQSELLASMTGSMACIAGGVMAVYIALGIPAEFLLAASLMAAPGALVISKIVYPETEVSETQGTVRLHVEKKSANLLDAIAAGASDGLKISLNVVAMLIGFLALIALVDALLGLVGTGLVYTGLTPEAVGLDLSQLSLKTLLGALFSVFAWCMGVPSADMLTAGSLMGTKLAVNEFVAYLDLAALLKAGTLDPRTVVVVSFALCGFANFASVAIQVGGIGQLAPERRADLSRLGFKALFCGTLASYLSASIAGILS
ncbi:MAG: nucleoside transporter C-terminal domain-containing protein [Bacteroidia bacterium]|nr:nucleoside transporter C-terminal domain-containing protein [Bacteroidia bacterium]